MWGLKICADSNFSLLVEFFLDIYLPTVCYYLKFRTGVVDQDLETFGWMLEHKLWKEVVSQ